MKQKILFCIFAFVFCLHAFDSFQSRYTGQIQDIKYITQSKDKYVFWLETNLGRDYYFGVFELPYFEINDSLFEYWIDYNLSGIGNNRAKYFYNVFKVGF